MRTGIALQAHYHTTLNDWRRVQNFIDEVADLKFAKHLRAIGNNQLEHAMKQIKTVSIEKDYTKNKVKKYADLFAMPIKKIEEIGINPIKLKQK